MSAHGLESRFQQIIECNTELVADYDAIDCNVPLEYSFDDVLSAFNTYKSVNKGADFTYTIKLALTNAVKYEQSIIDAINTLSSEASADSPSNSIQQYFKEVGNIYEKNNNDYNIEFCPENRDKLIEMNLKAVISIAKRYQGLGLSLQELISAGNYGLVVAFDKFDPNRSKLKDNVLSSVETLPDEFTFEELSTAVNQYFTYGDIKKKFADKFESGDVYKKKDVIKWVNKNIYNAKFNSIADNVDTTVNGLSTVVDGIEEADLKGVVESFHVLLKNINDPDGTVGKLLVDGSVYESLDALLIDVDSLVKKIEENPKKYMKLSVF